MHNAELLQRCQAGDERAIEELIQSHQRQIFHLALTLLDGPGMSAAELADEAEEATQDVLIAVLRALPGFQGKSAFTTWLYAITVNVCRNRYRKRHVVLRLKNTLQGLFRQARPDEEPTGAIAAHGLLDPEEQLLRREAGGTLWRQVCALGEKHRTVVILRYYHDFPVAEIAQMLGLSEGTVHSRLFTARERLRAVLQDAPTAVQEVLPRHECLKEKSL